MITLFSKTKNGKVFLCSKCNEIHIEFNNLNFNFSDIEYKHFSNYFLKLKLDEWERINKDSFYNKKIIIPIGHKNFNVILNREEFIELKQLLSPNKYQNQFQLISTSFLNFIQFNN